MGNYTYYLKLNSCISAFFQLGSHLNTAGGGRHCFVCHLCFPQVLKVKRTMNWQAVLSFPFNSGLEIIP